jgi:Flp pilus assembly pilin Flp
MCDPENPGSDGLGVQGLGAEGPGSANSGSATSGRGAARWCLRVRAARGRAGRFRQDQSGAMAVEFALILFPLCVLIFFVLETALVFWLTSALDNGLDASMRQFYVQSGGSATSLVDSVRSEICRQVSPFVRCENLKVDIGVYDSFTRIDRTSPIDAASGTWRTDFGIQHGCLTKGSVVVVQAAFAQHTFQKFGVVKNQFQNGSWLINATSVLQLEGNSTGGSGC